jgi:hypothetical protein
MDRQDGVVLHTMVGTLAGTDSMFHQDGYVGTESHFGVGADGTVYQWVDTERGADANLEGSFRLLSIETADMGGPFPSWSGSNVPAWTDAQLDAIAKIIAWAAKVHGFPVQRMPDSKPGSKGVGWHRMGIDGNFSQPDGQLLGGRVDGGQHWSTTTGKPCPGDRRIHQVVDEIIPRAKTFFAQIGDDDMQQNDPLYPVADPKGPTILAALQETYEAKKALSDLDSKIDNKVEAVNANVNNAETRLNTHIDNAESRINAKIDALVTAVNALSQ